MRDRRDELGDAEVVVVLFTAARNLRGYRHRFVEPLTVLTDETRSTYRAYGLGRGSWWAVWGPKVWRRYAQLVRCGERPGRIVEDTRQLGGDFVIAPDGRLAWVRPQLGPDDRPAVDDIVAAVRRAREPM